MNAGLVSTYFALGSSRLLPRLTYKLIHRRNLLTYNADHSPGSKRPLASIRRENLVLGKRVKEALLNGNPIVALESTVITHGLPEPQNFALALSLERKVASCQMDEAELSRKWSETCPTDGSVGDPVQHSAGSPGEPLIEPSANRPALPDIVTPATIGIVKGQLIVGLSTEEIRYLASRERSEPIKASRRDVPVTMALGLSAGTTVAATMAIASCVQAPLFSAPACAPSGGSRSSSSAIRVFATGGMGGVHLGGECSMDVSADLYEFARSPIGVVSSGFKSFLDTRRSLEYLETLGCTVMSLAPEVDESPDQVAASRYDHQERQQRRSLLFPAFFRAENKENIKSPCTVESIEEAARILYYCLEGPLAARRAALLAVPIPKMFSLDGDHEDGQLLERAMESIKAIDKRTDLEGKEKTPLILEHLNKATGGRSLRANIELLKNNATVGARLALRYAQMSNRTGAILESSFPERMAGVRSGTNGNEQPDLAATFSPPSSRKPSPAAPGAAGPLPSPSPVPGGEAKEPSGGQRLHASLREGDESLTRASRWQPAAAAAATFGPPVVVGCTMIDMHVSTKIDDRFKTNPTRSGVTFEGWPHLSVGGVGANLARALHLLGARPLFLTALANDNLASFALAEFASTGLQPGSPEDPHLAASGEPEGGLKVTRWMGEPEEEELEGARAPERSQAHERQGPHELRHGKSNERPPLQEDNNGGQKSLGAIAASHLAAGAAHQHGASSCFALVLMDSESGQCEYVIANLAAMQAIDGAAIETLALEHIQRAPLLVMDANLIDEALEYLLQLCHYYRKPVFLEPTDKLALPRLVECLRRMRARNQLSSLLCLSPNVIELRTMMDLFDGIAAEHDEGDDGRYVQVSQSKQQSMKEQHRAARDDAKSSLAQIELAATRLMQLHLPELKCLLVTMDKGGVLVGLRLDNGEVEIEELRLMEEHFAGAGSTACLSSSLRASKPRGGRQERGKEEEHEEERKEISATVATHGGKICEKASSKIIRLKHFPTPEPIERPVSASGAGDSFAAGFISALLNNSTLAQCLSKGFQASAFALRDRDTISRNLRQLAQRKDEEEDKLGDK